MHPSRLGTVCRRLCTNTPTDLTEGEKSLKSILQKKFPGASMIEVQDISGAFSQVIMLSKDFPILFCISKTVRYRIGPICVGIWKSLQIVWELSSK